MPDETVMAWIESGAGRIARGRADSVSSDGLRVRLAQEPDFGQGDEVAVRLSFEPGAPTVAAAARVDGLGEDGEGVLCDLRWTAPADQRRDLDAWLAHAA